MYAPKFRSWMTDWERFDEALSYKINAMAEEANAEIGLMTKLAIRVIGPVSQTEHRDLGRLLGELQAQYFPSDYERLRQAVDAHNTEIKRYKNHSIL